VFCPCSAKSTVLLPALLILQQKFTLSLIHSSFVFKNTYINHMDIGIFIDA